MPAARAGCCIARPPSSAVTIRAISVVRPGSSLRDRKYAIAVSTATPVTVTASMPAPPAMTLAAPASEAMVKVRIPAGERVGPPPLRRSRSAPISSPMPSAATRFRITEGRSGMFFLFAGTSWRAPEAAAAVSSDVDHDGNRLSRRPGARHALRHSRSSLGWLQAASGSASAATHVARRMVLRLAGS